jgi:hypothetical protein
MRTLSKYFLYSLCALVLFSSCSYYARKNPELQYHINEGNVEAAYGIISKREKKWDKGNNRLLYYLNRGTLAWMLNKTEESTEYFLKADDYIEMYRRQYGKEALALITNKKATPYKGEEFEKLIFHYYLALNYLAQGNYEDAIVECRRMDIQLTLLDMKFKDKKNGEYGNKYQRDAFIHTVMGLIYDAAGEYNNAYIAYKNAVDIYQNEYSENFNLNVPEQLKLDLLRVCYKSGLGDELRRFEKEFGIEYNHDNSSNGDAVLFWNNGLGPVKGEESINLQIIRGEVGWVTLTNDFYGLSFPIFVGEDNTSDTSEFAKLEFIRMAFPKYVDRIPIYNRAFVTTDEQNHSFEIIENINLIAHKSMRDRWKNEFGQAVARLVMKKISEYSLRSENEDAGALLGIVNAVSEQADTRNWQTLPHSIYYTRISLPPGENKLTFSHFGQTDTGSVELNLNIRENRTTFHSIQTLESVFSQQ